MLLVGVCSKATETHIRGPIESLVLVRLLQTLRPVLLRFNVLDNLPSNNVISLDWCLAVKRCIVKIFKAFEPTTLLAMLSLVFGSMRMACVVIKLGDILWKV